ncbi:STAS domain-containing protein [Saccharopolyspora phatthalungensis]|uniref:Anti-sigma factor antagonist n=1 Tax=Saccharopolyspora phatthalungensis TaxID=664693 RepID=A0A840QHX0_9PSEU|nr:STAS domain-containing protein [Saccharopolyspora phatthalungensis]MBB5159831.1 anti-anti-sigma factor [Saccharopolyspora phatthalungensis]
MPTFADSSDPAAPLRLKTRWFDRVLLVEVAGEVELLNAPQVESELMAALDERPAVLVLDISGVTFLSSAGLAVLVRGRHRAGERTRFRVVANGAATLRPIQLTGLDQEIDVVTSREQAMAMAGDA